MLWNIEVKQKVDLWINCRNFQSPAVVAPTLIFQATFQPAEHWLPQALQQPEPCVGLCAGQIQAHFDARLDCAAVLNLACSLQTQPAPPSAGAVSRRGSVSPRCHFGLPTLTSTPGADPTQGATQANHVHDKRISSSALLRSRAPAQTCHNLSN